MNAPLLAMILPAILSFASLGGCADNGWSSDWSKSGDVNVRIDSAAVMKPKMLSKSGKEYEDQFEMLVIHITVENKASDAIKYRRWEAGQLSAGTSLKDDNGKSYQNRLFSTTNAVGGVKGSSTMLESGKQLRDVLLFEPPAEGAKTLKLTLAPQTGSGDGHAFEIPASAWK